MQVGQPSMLFLFGVAVLLKLGTAVDAHQAHSYKGRLTRNEVVESGSSFFYSSALEAQTPAPASMTATCDVAAASTGCALNNGGAAGNCNTWFHASSGICGNCYDVSGTDTPLTADNHPTGYCSCNPADNVSSLCQGVAADSTAQTTDTGACVAEFPSQGCDTSGGNCTRVFVAGGAGTSTGTCRDCITGTTTKITSANIGSLNPAGQLCHGMGNGTSQDPCVKPYYSTNCVADGGNCSYVYIPSMGVCGECFEGTTTRINPDNAPQLSFQVTFCNAVTTGTSGQMDASGAVGVAAGTSQNSTAGTSSNDETPIGHVMAVLCVALFIIFLPAAYVTMQGKGKAKESGGGGRRFEDDDDTRAPLTANRDT